jgi:hypothetical protein
MSNGRHRSVDSVGRDSTFVSSMALMVLETVALMATLLLT